MQIEAKAGQRGGTAVTSSTQNQNCQHPRLGAARGSHPLQLRTGGTRSMPNVCQGTRRAVKNKTPLAQHRDWAELVAPCSQRCKRPGHAKGTPVGSAASFPILPSTKINQIPTWLHPLRSLADI